MVYFLPLLYFLSKVKTHGVLVGFSWGSRGVLVGFQRIISSPSSSSPSRSSCIPNDFLIHMSCTRASSSKLKLRVFRVQNRFKMGKYWFDSHIRHAQRSNKPLCLISVPQCRAQWKVTKVTKRTRHNLALIASVPPISRRSLGAWWGGRRK